MELEPLGGPVYLTDPASFAAGQPWESYRWLRANDPVHFHPETDGPGFWAVTRYADVSFTIPATAGAIVNFPSIVPVPPTTENTETLGDDHGGIHRSALSGLWFAFHGYCGGLDVWDS
jgi:cytochrome P450